MSMTSYAKEKRLQALAKRAGDLMVKAYLGGNRERAVFFNEKRKRILKPLWGGAQEAKHGTN